MYVKNFFSHNRKQIFGCRFTNCAEVIV